MLSLRAVDVHRVGGGDGDHEHRSIAGLAVLVPAVAGIGRAVGVSGDGLEVGEDRILRGLARAVGVGLSNRVVLQGISAVMQDDSVDAYLGNEVESNHVSRLSGDRVGSKLELVVRRDSDHHSGGGSGHGLGKPGSEDSGEKHVEVVVVEIRLL